MTRPRATLVSVADTPYYHCINRCVRRAFLCGDDPLTGKSFHHRRQWLLERLKLLTDTFAIELCAYAVMCNHYHLVVRIDAERAATWSADDIATRWARLFKGPAFLARYLAGSPLSPAEQSHFDDLIPVWSVRLANLSWFERCLNETIARLANAEDDCTGRFWEGRFKSQALLDDGALLTAMVYVDLNPIRAGAAQNLTESDFTSVQQRLFEVAMVFQAQKSTSPRPTLRAFAGTLSQDTDDLLPFNLQDYFVLVETTGRIACSGMPGYVPPDEPPLLAMLGLDANEWFATVTQLQRRFHLFVGAPHRLRRIARERGWHWVRGLAAGRRLYARANE